MCLRSSFFLKICDSAKSIYLNKIKKVNYKNENYKAKDYIKKVKNQCLCIVRDLTERK